MVKAIHILVPILAAVVYTWLQVKPKITWTPAPEQDYPACPKGMRPTLVFGATSMLGRYIMDTYSKDQKICTINYGRSHCPKCTINVKGDLRDTRHVHRVLDFYKPDTVLTSVKPPLLGIHYREYIELNLLSMLELVKAAKAKGVKYFIYVSSIAASSHYLEHDMSPESDPKPLYTDYEAPYDVSKRIAEDYILDAHEEGKFNTIAIRTSGIIGGTGDPYDYFRLPFIVTFGCPAVIDANFAANIGDALYEVDKTFHKDAKLGGQFYYYTGEHNSEDAMAEWAAAASGKPLLKLPFWVLETVIEWWTWARFDHNTYSTLDLMRMAVVPQTFDQTKFHKSFPGFKAKYTMKDAMFMLYGKN